MEERRRSIRVLAKELSSSKSSALPCDSSSMPSIMAPTLTISPSSSSSPIPSRNRSKRSRSGSGGSAQMSSSSLPIGPRPGRPNSPGKSTSIPLEKVDFSHLSGDEAVWKPTEQQLQVAKYQFCPDVLPSLPSDPPLRLLLVGINPSLYSTAVGHHFARPGNRMWPALHLGGITPERWSPFQDKRFASMGIGITNLVARSTSDATEVSAEEFRQGAIELSRKVAQYKPLCVSFLGISTLRLAFPDLVPSKLKLQCGPLPMNLFPETPHVSCYLMPNPSGRNAHFTVYDIGDMFAALKKHVEELPVTRYNSSEKRAHDSRDM